MHDATYRRLFVFPLMLLLLTAGCWDRREIEERSNVLASGIDLCHQDTACRIVISRQIAIPGRIPLGAGGGSKGGGETVVVLATPGQNPPDSAARAQQELNRMINFGQTRIQVFSEEYARQGLAEYVDYLRRNPEFRRLIWVLVSEGPAEDVLRARPSLERVPALFLNDMIEDAGRTGRLPTVTLGDFLVHISSPGEEPFAPLIRMVDRDSATITGLAVFRRDKMVGKLDLPETATFLHLRGRTRAREQMNISLRGGKGAAVTIYGSVTRYQVSTERGHIHVLVRMSADAELTALSPGLDSSDPSLRAVLDRKGAQEMDRRARALVERLQHELHSDILGVGESVRARLPDVWASIPDWNRAFAEVTFDFEMQFRVRRMGMAQD